MTHTEPREVTFDNKTYTLDAHGFLNPPEQWDENFANGMAEVLGIYAGLKEKHWSFIRYLRKKFLEEKTVPVVVLACADNDLRLSEFKLLFPTGYHRGACKIAGINYDFMYKTNYWLTYETSAVLRAEHEVTAAGFLADFEKWNERFAEAVVREWKLPGGLTERHRNFIRYVHTVRPPCQRPQSTTSRYPPEHCVPYHCCGTCERGAPDCVRSTAGLLTFQ